MTVFHVFEFVFWGLFIFFLRYLGTWLFMINYLAIKNAPYSQAGRRSVTRLPLSQHTTPSVGCGRQWGSRPVSSQHCFSAFRSCQPQCTIGGVLAVSEIPCSGLGGGRVARYGEMSLHFCNFVFSIGFRHNVYWPLRLECCFFPFTTCH